MTTMSFGGSAAPIESDDAQGGGGHAQWDVQVLVAAVNTDAGGACRCR